MPRFLFLFSLAGLLNFAHAELAKPQVIYGSDGRHDTQNVSDPRLISIASRGVALMNKKDLVEKDATHYWLNGESYGKTLNLCPGERFFDQPSVSFCSGLLITPDIILTAGHCLHTQAGCSETAVVFDYQSRTLPRSSAYFCKEILYEVDTDNLDLAFVRLDRKVKDRAPYNLKEIAVPKKGDSLVMIGHPSGLPQKITVGGITRGTDLYHIKASLDAFEYNSGSPVFERRSMKFAGILVAGEEDFVPQEPNTCSTAKVCPEHGCRGEDVLRAEHVLKVFNGL